MEPANANIHTNVRVDQLLAACPLLNRLVRAHVRVCVCVDFQVTVLGLIALWFRQVREGEMARGEGAESVTLPDKSKLFEALQRLPISFGMAMRVRLVLFLFYVVVSVVDVRGCLVGWLVD